MHVVLDHPVRTLQEEVAVEVVQRLLHTFVPDVVGHV
jgi:hypothetical protein